MAASGNRLVVCLVLGLVAISVAAGCGKVSTCRPGTLFLHVNLGQYATANRLDVDILVEGSTTPQHTQLTLTGVGAGGVEVEFPNGYPTGRYATVTLTLFSQSTEVAQRASTVYLPGSCAVAEVDFSRDAGQDAPAGGRGAHRGAQVGAEPAVRAGLRPAVQAGLRPAVQGGLRPAVQAGLRPVVQAGLRPVVQAGRRPVVQAGRRPELVVRPAGRAAGAGRGAPLPEGAQGEASAASGALPAREGRVARVFEPEPRTASTTSTTTAMARSTAPTATAVPPSPSA